MSPPPASAILFLPAKKESGKWLWYVFAVALVLFAISKSASTFGDGTFGDGTYSVGAITPGKYYTSGPASNRRSCSWKRLKDTSGNPNSVIVENLEDGPVTVVIYPSDGAFETAGCNGWRKVG
jgi:hypothetical protein